MYVLPAAYSDIKYSHHIIKINEITVYIMGSLSLQQTVHSVNADIINLMLYYQYLHRYQQHYMHTGMTIHRNNIIMLIVMVSSCIAISCAVF